MALGKKADWSRKLSATIRLKDGRDLVTLGDASKIILEELSGLRSPALAKAVELLMLAAQSGKLADRKVATEQVGIVLRFSRLL